MSGNTRSTQLSSHAQAHALRKRTKHTALQPCPSTCATKTYEAHSSPAMLEHMRYVAIGKQKECKFQVFTLFTLFPVLGQQSRGYFSPASILRTLISSKEMSGNKSTLYPCPSTCATKTYEARSSSAMPTQMRYENVRSTQLSSHPKHMRYVGIGSKKCANSRFSHFSHFPRYWASDTEANSLRLLFLEPLSPQRRCPGMTRRALLLE